MKNTTLNTLWVLLFCISISSAQEIIFDQNGKTFSFDIETRKKNNITSKNYNSNSTFKALDKIAIYPEEISTEIKLSNDYDLFQALQSPFDAERWVFMEREQFEAGFKLTEFNGKTSKNRQLLINKNTSRNQKALKPIGWINAPNKILVELLYLDSDREHEGILIYDLSTKETKKINIPFHYTRTPLISPDRSKLFFLGTLDDSVDYIHGNTDVLYEFNIQTGKARTIISSKGQSITLKGWKHQISNSTSQKTQSKFSSLDYYLPWDAGVSLCVSRHGTPGPSGSHVNQGRCNIFGPGGHHGYAAIDFATSLSSDQNVRAAASGTVTFSGVSGSLSSGYGRLVIIRHSDGTRTYYAHNKSLLVSNGQTVTRGQVIAKEGTTGGSTGDHIHFEWRAAGGNASTKGRFKGIGEPRQDYRYKSNNTVGTPPPSSDTSAPTTSISASGGNTQAGDFTANFSDNDNVGVTRRFYQALEKYGDNWYANRGNGFFNDNFNVLYSGYTTGAGNWNINDKHLRQSNTSSDNTKLSTYLSQNSGLPYLYEFSAKTISTSGPRKFGIHIMASDATQSQRGNSYLIWFSGEDNKVRIYETINNVLNFRVIADVSLDNNWANYKITYSPGFGVLEVFKNNRSILKWTDSSPIKNGSTISLRTNKTVVEFDDLKVYKFRATGTQGISAGTAVTKDIRRRNGKVKSLVRDAAGNWSLPGNLDVTISSLTKENPNIQDDTYIETNDILVYPNPTDGTSIILNYQSASDAYTAISITDITGRVLTSFYKYSKESVHQSLNLSNYFTSFKNGQYFIKVSSKNGSKVLPVIKN
ncbi:peptidoglycan DD-metalloendopeptidase family protein [uncultured Aquimarina sp.]|uniref:peptidoglycan DD-metalloendopeptidase family protein n=1 Tax=uncultured Aquimarina sp. TaxID=575652 RepID=UPI002630509A|nr:peptidoglycan DD-metalloendopeptidase family protein [uncultured Aquimarina sp.]